MFLLWIARLPRWRVPVGCGCNFRACLRARGLLQAQMRLRWQGQLAQHDLRGSPTWHFHSILKILPGCAAWHAATLACKLSSAPAQVCIFTKGGALLWTWQMAALRGLPVDALIRTCLLEERSGESSFSYTPPSGAAYTLKWTLHNVRGSRAARGSVLRWMGHGGIS